MAQGPLGGPRPFIEVRQTCQPELNLVLDGIQESREIIELSEESLFERETQFDDIVVGTREGHTTVRITFLREKVSLEAINDYIEKMEKRYVVKSASVGGSKERR